MRRPIWLWVELAGWLGLALIWLAVQEAKQNCGGSFSLYGQVLLCSLFCQQDSA